MTGNKAKGNKVGGSLKMSTDSGKGNTAEDNEVAKSLSMTDRKSSRMTIFGYRANGPIAIIALVIILIAYFLYGPS